MNATLLNLLECVFAVAAISAGAALFVRHLRAVESVFAIRSSTLALIIPVLGPAGWATTKVFQSHSGLRVISASFSWASALILLVAGGLSLLLGIKSINPRIFRIFLVCMPIPIATAVTTADARISHPEAFALILVYATFIASVWWYDRLERPAVPQPSLRLEKWSRLAPIGGLLLTVAGSALLIACARMEIKLHHRVLGSALAASGVIAQVFTFAYASMRQNRSDLAVACVMGTLAFTSTVTLAAFGIATHNHKLDPSAHLMAAFAMLAVPVLLFPLAFRQTKHLGVSANSRDTDAHMDNIFAWRNLKRDLSNFQILHHRNANGNLVTGMNSGTHWVTVMLATAIARQHNLPLPEFFSFDAASHLVGIPRRLVRRPGIPAIVLSHNHPAALVASRIVRRILPYPKQVVLVRDIRDVLVSAYVKWMPNGEIPFSEFVRGDPSNQRGNICDVWWYISYLNRWGDVKSGAPEDTLVVRYEDMVENPAFWLRRMGSQFGIEFGDDAIAAALTLREKTDVMAKRHPDDTERIIADPALKSSVRFTESDMQELRRILSRHLRYDYGYDYGLRGVPLIPVFGMRAASSSLSESGSIQAPLSTSPLEQDSSGSERPEAA